MVANTLSSKNVPTVTPVKSVPPAHGVPGACGYHDGQVDCADWLPAGWLGALGALFGVCRAE